MDFLGKGLKFISFKRLLSSATIYLLYDTSDGAIHDILDAGLGEGVTDFCDAENEWRSDNAVIECV